MAKKPSWYSIEAQAGADSAVHLEIRIYDEIGYWGISAKEFISELDAAAAAAQAAAIVVAINSPGGDVFDAFAIYNALRRYSGRITTRVDGVAASAASLVLMAGDQIIMPENAMIMIHLPATCIAGTAADMRKTADVLDKARDGILAAYRNKSGQNDAALIAMMEATTWLTALEAQAMGFADVIEQPVKLQASAHALTCLQNLHGVPAALVQEMVAAAPPPAAMDAGALARHAFQASQQAGLGNYAEAIIARSSLQSVPHIEIAIDSARLVASLCLAAKLPELTDGFIRAGLSADQVRARLYERISAIGEHEIHNKPPQDSAPVNPAGPSAIRIYAELNQRKGVFRP